MESKERVKLALNHREADRVPMMMSAGSTVVRRLKQALNVRSDRDLLRALNIDVFDIRGIDYKGAIGAAYIGPDNRGISSDWNGDFFELFGYREIEIETRYGKSHAMGPPCMDVVRYPTIETVASYPWPDPDWFDYSTVRPQLEPWGDFAIAATGCSIFQHPQLFRGVEQLTMELASNPDLADYIMDRVTTFYLGYFQRLFQEVGDLIDIFRVADDIGGQQNLLISPRMLDRHIGPRLQQCTALAHAYDIKVLFHTDGNVRSAIPNLIEWGVDILDPLQPEAPGMDPDELKADYGNRLSFSGGVSAQDVLSQQDSAAVRAEVKRAIELLAPGGGYILSPGHPSLQVDIPIENIVAMYEAGLEFGSYRS